METKPEEKKQITEQDIIDYKKEYDSKPMNHIERREEYTIEPQKLKTQSNLEENLPEMQKEPEQINLSENEPQPNKYLNKIRNA